MPSAGVRRIGAIKRWKPGVRRLGFDDRFIRMWDHYLSISEVSISTGMTQDLQIGFQKARGTA